MTKKRVRKILQDAGYTLLGAPRSFKRGMAGSWLFLVQIHELAQYGTVVFKTHKDLEFIRREKQRQEALSAAFGDLFVKCYNPHHPNFLILEFVDDGDGDGASNLVELLHEGRAQWGRIRRALTLIVKHSIILWRRTHRPAQPGERTLYQSMNREFPEGRILAYLERTYQSRQEVLDASVTVNGDEYPLSLRDAARLVHTILNADRVDRWATHGDLKGDNILVLEDGNVRLIDPRAEADDWVNDLAILSRTRSIPTAQQFVAQPMRLVDGRLVLESDVHFSQVCDIVSAFCVTTAQQVATDDEFRDPEWEVRFWAHVAATYFNEMQFYHQRKEWGIIPRVTHPETFLFGEAVRAAHRAKEAAKEVQSE